MTAADDATPDLTGITPDRCPTACTTGHCVISTVNVCKHPCKTTDEGCGPVTMANRRAALEAVKEHVRATYTEFAGLTRTTCCDGCRRDKFKNLDFCQITENAFCGNPFLGEAVGDAGEKGARIMRARQQIISTERWG
jgi:hypothetical protein